MPDEIVIRLAGPPAAKGRGRIGTAGGRPMVFTPVKTRAYAAALRYAAQEAMVKADRPPFLGPLEVSITAALPVPRSWSKKKRARAMRKEVAPTKHPDIDNYAKQIDALNGVVFVDDSQIVSLIVSKLYAEIPELVIRVWELETEAA